MEYAPPPFFKRGPSPLFRLAVFSFLALALIVMDARFHYLGPLRQAVSVLVYPLQKIAAAPVAVAGRVSEFFVTQAQIRADNSRLAKENLLANGTAQQLDALRAENAELRALLQARERIKLRTVMSEVLYTARDPFLQRIVIDRGLTDDLAAGLAVVDDVGVVGQITRVYPFSSEVTLITDKDQAVPVQNLRSGLRAILFGNGRSGTLDLRFMPVNADIQNGDTLVTSGIDGTYPPGLPVARVANIERNASAAFARITCTPLAGVGRRGNVLVLVGQRAAPERPADPP